MVSVVLPHALDHILRALVLLLPDEEVPVLGRAPLDLHELVELQHPPLAAAIPLAAFVEDGEARVVHAALIVPPADARVVRRAARLALAGRAVRYGERRVVVGVFLRGGGLRGRGRGLRLRLGREARGLGGRGGDVGRGGLGLGRGRVVDVGVGAGGAGRDGEELVEGEDARFAALPA